MIILVGSQKGGCSKSTIAMNIAVELIRLNKDICLVDADRQPTVSRWKQIRDETDLPPVHSVAQYGKIHTTLKDLDKRYDYVIVDVAGRDSQELRHALFVADLLLAPFRPSPADTDTFPHLSKLISEVELYNPNLTCKAVITMALSNPKVNEVEIAQEQMKDFPEFELCKTIIGDRKIYRDVLHEGKGVIECGNKLAKAEIQSLVKELKL